MAPTNPDVEPEALLHGIRAFELHPLSSDPRKFNLRHLKEWAEGKNLHNVVRVVRRANGVVSVRLDDDGLRVNLSLEGHFNGVSYELRYDEAAHPNGVITHPEIRHLDLDDLFHLLDPSVVNNIVGAHIFHDSATAKIMFVAEPPATIKLGWEEVPVRPYRPLPIRCRNCQGYGHFSKACTAPAAICGRCAGRGHTAVTCTSSDHCCASCGGPHPVTDRDCPAWQRAKQISSTQHREGLTYSEALQRHQTPTPPPPPADPAPTADHPGTDPDPPSPPVTPRHPRPATSDQPAPSPAPSTASATSSDDDEDDVATAGPPASSATAPEPPASSRAASVAEGHETRAKALARDRALPKRRRRHRR